MMSETQQTVANLQHSLLFLQQEHARTLHDLHDEISTLQKKCSDQTFKLTLHGLLQSADESPVPHLETVITGLRNKNTEMRGTLETKEKRITFLEEQSRSREKRFQDDLKNASRKIGELELELDNRAANIVYLTTQLHQAKIINVQHETGHMTVELQKSPPRAHQQKMLRNNMPPPNTTIEAPAVRSSYSPSPPQGQPIKSGRRSQLNRRSATSPAATASLGGVISESGSSQQLPAPSEIASAALPKASKFVNSTRMPKPMPLRDDDGPARPAMGLSQARRDRYGELRLSNSGVSLHHRRVAGNVQPPHRPNDYEEVIRISKSTDKSATKIQLVPPSKSHPLPPITTRTGRQLRNNGPAAGTSMTSKAARKGIQPPAASCTNGKEIEHLIIEPLAASPEKSFRPTAQNSTSK